MKEHLCNICKKRIKTKFMWIKTKKLRHNHCNLIIHILIIV